MDDLARYEALAASADQYGRGLEQARAICVQVRETRDNSFGQAAKGAAEELVAEAEQVLAAFTQLVAAWKAQESSFLATQIQNLTQANQVKQNQLVQEFAAMEAALSQNQSTSSWLTSQLAALPTP